LKYAKEMAQQLKEQQCINRQESKRKKKVEQEEGRLARATAREDAARSKELQAVEQAEVRARRQAQCDEIQRLHAEWLALAAATKAAKATKKARKATTRQEQLRLWAVRAAEMAQGCQGGLRSVEAVAMELEVPHPNTSSSIPEHFTPFCTPQNLLFFFSSSPTFPPMPSLGPLSFQQLNTPMQSTQPSHPILQYSSHFQVFHNSLHHNSQWGREMPHQ
jgi:hypothetical protein